MEIPYDIYVPKDHDPVMRVYYIWNENTLKLNKDFENIMIRSGTDPKVSIRIVNFDYKVYEELYTVQGYSIYDIKKPSAVELKKETESYSLAQDESGLIEDFSFSCPKGYESEFGITRLNWNTLRCGQTHFRFKFHQFMTLISNTIDEEMESGIIYRNTPPMLRGMVSKSFKFRSTQFIQSISKLGLLIFRATPNKLSKILNIGVLKESGNPRVVIRARCFKNLKPVIDEEAITLRMVCKIPKHSNLGVDFDIKLFTIRFNTEEFQEMLVNGRKISSLTKGVNH